MDNPETQKSLNVKSKQIIHIALQLLALAFLLSWCFDILAPFLTPIMWAAILAVTLFPLHQKAKRRLKGKATLAAVLITSVIFILFILIGSWLGVRTGSEIKTTVSNYQDGKLKIPHPPESVKHWPVIGNKTFLIWTQLTTGVDSIFQK
jgi:predicted PurR-regulated permease PerM